MNKQQIIPFAALTLVVLGGVTAGISKMSPSIANAQTPVAQIKQVAEKLDNDGADKNEQEPTYTSSIRVPESKQEMDDGAEAKQLASLAKISSEQAKAAAEKSAGGKASSVKLEEENGNVVYKVTVGTKEVIVDAGNGKILHTETAEAGESGEKEGVESD